MSTTTPNKPPHRNHGFLSSFQLKMLAIITTLTLTNLVPLSDIAFAVFSLIYTQILAKFSFKPNNKTLETKILPIYVSTAASIGLYLPILYIFEAFFNGDNARARAASPHLFLLASQIFMEGVVYKGGYSIPISIFVPVYYHSKRIPSIVDWLRFEFGENGSESWRFYVGTGLAIGNLGFWCFNLFGYLLPIYLPRAFKKYYSEAKEDPLVE